jgi:putative hydrolase
LEGISKYLKCFNDVDDAYLHMDMHIHSNWTDGQNSIEEIVEYSKKIGLNMIAITDHIRFDSSYFNDYKMAIEKIQKNSNIKILVGFEAKIKNFRGEIDVKADVAKLANLKIASVHRFPFADKLFSADAFNKEIAQAIELDLCLGAIENGGFDVLGHAGGMCLKKFGEFPMEYFEQIIIACKQNNIVFEINSYYHCNIYSQLKSILKKHNPLVSFGSDAHEKKKIAEWLFLKNK